MARLATILRRSLRSHWAWGWLILIAFGCHAQTADLWSQEGDALRDHYRSLWNVRDGAPSGIHQVKEGKDGFMWLATEGGLFRFDGVEFTKYVPPQGQHLLKEGPIIALTPTSDGGIWVSYRFGGVSHIHGQIITNYPASKTLPQGIYGFVEDWDHNIWATSSHGLFCFDGLRWMRIGVEFGARIEQVDHLRVDQGGDLWVDDSKEYLILPRGAKAFTKAKIPAGKIDFLSRDNGWLAVDDDGLHRLRRSAAGEWTMGPLVLKENISILGHTQDGRLWFGAHDGLGQLEGADKPNPGPASLLKSPESHGVNWVFWLSVGADGSIWTVTADGLGQLRPTVFVNAELPSDMEGLSLAPSSDGVLVGSAFHASTMLMRVHAGAQHALNVPFHAIHMIYGDPKGTVWISADGQLWTLEREKLSLVPAPEGLGRERFKLRSMTLDQHGDFWCAAASDGPDEIYVLHNRQWLKKAIPENLRSNTYTSMYGDRSGRVWIASPTRLLWISDTHTGVIASKDGYRFGPATEIKEYGDRIWFAGPQGLGLFRHGKLQPVLRDDGKPLASVSGVVEAMDGSLWISIDEGLLHIANGIWQGQLNKPVLSVYGEIFNHLDGVPGAPIIRLQTTSGYQASDGALYFLTREGLVSTDSKRLAHMSGTPRVSLGSVIADHQVLSTASEVHLPKATSSLQINYTATGSAVPSRTRFRYKLEGFDRDWQDVGYRRSAFYAQLSPKDYQFLVEATLDGVHWSEPYEPLAISLPPTFLQSAYFKVLLALAVVGVITGLYLIRVEMVKRDLRRRLYDLLAERERIARDLHDTFFQSIQGLLLHFSVGTSMLPPSEPGKALLQEALGMSDQVMMEAREAIFHLSAEDTSTIELIAELNKLRQQGSLSDDTELQIRADGTPRPINQICARELSTVLREAVFNSYKHAQASRIDVVLQFERATLTAMVRDNGRGIEPDILEQGYKSGHLGLVSMRQRAERLGGRFRIDSQLDAGTLIIIKLSASVAYSFEQPERQRLTTYLRRIWPTRLT